MEISKKIKAHLTEKKLTQKQLSDRLNVSDKTISSWENARTYPDILMIIKLSEIFEISLDTFLKEDQNIVEKISKDTSLRKKQSIRIKLLGALVIVMLFLLVYIFYRNINISSINKTEEIRQLTLNEEYVSFDVELPFYRSVSCYMIESGEKEGEATLSIGSGFDWTFSNVEYKKIFLDNFEGIHEIKVIDNQGNVLKTAQLSD